MSPREALEGSSELLFMVNHDYVAKKQRYTVLQTAVFGGG